MASMLSNVIVEHIEALCAFCGNSHVVPGTLVGVLDFAPLEWWRYFSPQ
jgi:hypothetical protein